MKTTLTNYDRRFLAQCGIRYDEEAIEPSEPAQVVHPKPKPRQPIQYSLGLNLSDEFDEEA